MNESTGPKLSNHADAALTLDELATISGGIDVGGCKPHSPNWPPYILTSEQNPESSL
jgi:hypothetical protein